MTKENEIKLLKSENKLMRSEIEKLKSLNIKQDLFIVGLIERLGNFIHH